MPNHRHSTPVISLRPTTLVELQSVVAARIAWNLQQPSRFPSAPKQLVVWDVTDEIGTVEDAKLRAGPVSSATMGFKIFL